MDENIKNNFFAEPKAGNNRTDFVKPKSFQDLINIVQKMKEAEELINAEHELKDYRKSLKNTEEKPKNDYNISDIDNDDIHVKSMTITLDPSHDEWAHFFAQEKVRISDFFIVTESLSILHVIDCKFDISEEENETKINITDCKVLGVTDSLGVAAVRDLSFLCPPAIRPNWAIEAKSIEIELEKGNEVEKSILGKQKILVFAYEHEPRELVKTKDDDDRPKPGRGGAGIGVRMQRMELDR